MAIKVLSKPLTVYQGTCGERDCRAELQCERGDFQTIVGSPAGIEGRPYVGILCPECGCFMNKSNMATLDIPMDVRRYKSSNPSKEIKETWPE